MRYVSEDTFNKLVTLAFVSKSVRDFERNLDMASTDIKKYKELDNIKSLLDEVKVSVDNLCLKIGEVYSSALDTEWKEIEDIQKPSADEQTVE